MYLKVLRLFVIWDLVKIKTYRTHDRFYLIIEECGLQSRHVVLVTECARGISGNLQIDRIKTVLIGGTCNLFKKLFFVVGLITHGIVFQFYIKPHLLLVYTSI